MTGQLDFPDGFEQNYEPAPPEICLAWSLRMLERLYGVELDRLPSAGEGECDDGCGRTAQRLTYGTLKLCRRCALLRRRASKRAA